VARVGFAHDGELIVASGGAAGMDPDPEHEDYDVKVWNAVSGRPVAALGGHRHAVTDWRLGEDGATVITLSLDETARRWRLPVAVAAGTPSSSAPTRKR
jgi:WD40 repeat protein